MQWNLDCRALARLLELLSRNFGAELLTRLAISSRTAATWSGLYFPRLGSRCRPHAFLNRMGRKASESMLRPIQSLAGKSEAGALAVWPFPGQSLLYHREAICISDCKHMLQRYLAAFVGWGGAGPASKACRRSAEGRWRLQSATSLPSPSPFSSSAPSIIHPLIHSPPIRTFLAPISLCLSCTKCKLARQRSSMVMARWCYCTSHEIAHAHPAEKFGGLRFILG